MRVVLPTLHYYRDRPSGSTRLAYDEAVYLARRGHEPWIVTQDLTRSLPEHTVDAGVHVLRYPAPVMRALNPRRASIHQHLTAALLDRYVPQADVVHGHALLQYAGALDYYGRRVRACYSVHSPVSLEMKAGRRGASTMQKALLTLNAEALHRIERRCLEGSDSISSYSQFTRKTLGALHSLAIAERTEIIPGWVDLDQFRIAKDRLALKQELGWPREVPVLFTLRRLVPRMGLDRLVRASAMLKQSGASFHLVIGGAGPLKQSLETLIAELDLAAVVRCSGLVPQESLPDMYAAADAFVLPTAELECFGLIALEALASGRPVLATPVAAIPEIVGQVEPRWLATDGSSEGLYALLADYLAGRLPAHAPEDLRRFVAAHYAHDTILERLTAWALGTEQVDLNSGVIS